MEGQTVTFPAWKSFQYRQVWLITERRDGCIYKTKPIGYCEATRPKQDNEVYSVLGTEMTKDVETITLTLLP